MWENNVGGSERNPKRGKAKSHSRRGLAKPKVKSKHKEVKGRRQGYPQALMTSIIVALGLWTCTEGARLGGSNVTLEAVSGKDQAVWWWKDEKIDMHDEDVSDDEVKEAVKNSVAFGNLNEDSTEEYIEESGILLDQSNRILSGSSFLYTYSMSCPHKTDGVASCNQNGQSVTIDEYSIGTSGSKDIVFRNPYSIGQTFQWKCGGTVEDNVDSDRNKQHKWNRVKATRNSNSNKDEIDFKFYLCTLIGSYTSGTNDHKVVLANSLPLTGNTCLAIPGGNGYGIESLRQESCATKEEQNFYLYPESNDKSKYKLRPSRSIQHKLDVCLKGTSTGRCQENAAMRTVNSGTYTYTTNSLYKIVPADTPTFSVDPSAIEVLLFNSASGAMMSLHLSRHEIYGFNAVDKASSDISKVGKVEFKTPNVSETTFFLTRIKDQNEKFTGDFILRPKGTYSNNVDGCLTQADPFTIADCTSGDSVKWTVNGGRIINKKDSSRCITHQINNNIGAAQACSRNPNAYVMIVEKVNGWTTGGTKGKHFPQIERIFPASGIHLVGAAEYSSVKMRPSGAGSVQMNKDLVIEFTFELDSDDVGTLHRVCLETDRDMEWCFHLAGSSVEERYRALTVTLQEAAANKANEYILNVHEFFDDTILLASTVTYVRFDQDGESTTRSRFTSIAFYQMTPVEVEERLHRSLTLRLGISNGIDTNDLNFLPSVLVQEEDGGYHSSIPAAEKRISTNGKLVTVVNLLPGRRYLIRLDPVNSVGQPFPDNDEKALIKAFFVEYTSCSCTADEETGKPLNLIPKQLHGSIIMNFGDNSVCEEAYAMTRRLVVDTGSPVSDAAVISYVPNYFFYSILECSDEVVEPSSDFSDIVSGLVVGNTYEYCVSAVSKHYMVDSNVTDKKDGSFVRSSDETCEDHKVLWESSARVKVTLSSQAGSLPVHDTTLTWELFYKETSLDSGTALTPENGEVLLNFYVDPNHSSLPNLSGNNGKKALNSRDQLALRIVPSKISNGRNHVYLCADESVPCPTEVKVGYETFLSHLDESDILFVDNTLIPLSGTVYIGKPEGNAMTKTGCTLPGADVCLLKVDHDIPLECKNSNSDGSFILYALIGLRVYPTVKMAGHEFSLLASNSDSYSQGLEATFENFENGLFTGHDFLDNTTSVLYVTVAGGACDIRLGESKLELTLKGCSSDYYRETPDQDTVHGSYVVPAHAVNVRVTGLSEKTGGDREFVMKRFREERRTVDLAAVRQLQLEADRSRNQTNDPGGRQPNATDTSAKMDDEIKAASTARFQYNGVLNIDPEIAGGLDFAGGCHPYVFETVYRTRSFHVVKSKDKFDLTLWLQQLILPDEDPPVYCGIVDDSTEVYVRNDVGLNDDDAGEQESLALLEKKGADTSRYTRCTKGCLLTVQELDAFETKSNILIGLQAGIPKVAATANELHPHSKLITIRSGDSLHTMHVAITGDYSPDKGDSFSLPTHKPLLILRDPPGGDSSVTYTNIESTMTIRLQDYEKYEGWDAGVYIGPQVKTGTGASAGVGAEVSAKTADAELSGNVVVDGGSMELKSSSEGENAAEVTILWSYQTAGSDGLGYAGQASDVFLVPTLAVMYRKTWTVKFDSETCKAHVPDPKIKFDLSNDGNRAPFSFLSHYLIMVEIMPELEANLQLLVDELASETITAERNQTIVDELIPAANASILGWNSTLAEYDATNKAAQETTLESVGKWFVNDLKLDDLKKRPICEKRDFTYCRINDCAIGGYDGDANTTEPQYRCSPADAKPPISETCLTFKGKETCSPASEIEEKFESNRVFHTTEWEPIDADHGYYSLWEFSNPQIAKDSVSLVPKKWMDKAKELNSTKAIADEVSIQPGGSFHFSGGGNILSLEFDKHDLDQLSEMWNNPLDQKSNADEYIKAGLEVDGKYAFGAGLMVGFQAGVHGFYQQDVTHRMSTETDSSESTSISVEFGDPHHEDEFLVDMYLDPIYNTFVFVTREGRSKCPCEKGTRCIEIPSINVLRTPGPLVPSDNLMIFEMEVANLGYGESMFYLLSEKLENSGGLSIAIDGANLNMLSPWRLKGTAVGGTMTTSTLTIARGPSRYAYEPIDIYLQSKCEFNEEFGSAKNSATLTNDVVKNEDNTTTDIIRFTPPCLEVEWAGKLREEGRFIVNSTDPRSLSVTVYNPQYFYGIKMVNSIRLKKVIVEYKKVSERSPFPTWMPGLDIDGNELDFLKVEESSFGHATQIWKVPPDEAEYEVRLKSVCEQSDTAPDRLNKYISGSVFGIVDTVAPTVFGLPSPLTNLHPGQRLQIAFTEELDCELPYQFKVEMHVVGFLNAFDLDELDAICSDNVIRVQFREDGMPSTYEALLGREFNLTVSDVKDKAGNVMEQSFEFSSNFVCLPPKPQLEIFHPSGAGRIYLPNEPIVFQAVIANGNKAEDWSKSTLELGVDLSTNNADFEIVVNGEPLTDSQRYSLQSSENITTEIALLKGPGKRMKFPPITLFLRSDCVQDNHDPVVVANYLWNWEDENGDRYIKFTPSCPPIRWAGNMNLMTEVMLNNATLHAQDSLVEVSIFNEFYTDRTLFERTNDTQVRLRNVLLLYRRVGDWGSTNHEDWSDSEWVRGVLRRTNSTTDSAPNSTVEQLVDFSMQNIEDGLGFATLWWDVSPISFDDSSYEVKVVSHCDPIKNDSISEHDSFSTESVRVTIDRSPPSVYGVPNLQLPNNFHPSHEWIIPFTEELYCNEPYVFELSLVMKENNNITVHEFTKHDGLYVKCEGKVIKYRFAVTELDNYAALANLNVRVELSGVEDLARNPIAAPYMASYRQCDQLLSGARVYRGMGCDGLDNDCDLFIDECDEDIIPPTISFDSVLDNVKVEDGVIVHTVLDRCFAIIEDARQFLIANIAVSDDCSEKVSLNVTYIDGKSNSSLATFNATATDERCKGGEGIHVTTEFFQVEMFDGFDSQGLIPDDTIVRGMGCDRMDQNCNGIIDDCDEDLVPPVIFMSEGVSLTELSNHTGMKFVTSHCFDKSEDVYLFLEENVYAEDDCAKDINITIEEVTTSHTWKKNHKYNLAEYLVTATDVRCGVSEYWSVNKTFLVEVFDEYDEDVKQQGCNGFDENCDGVVDDCTEDRVSPTISFREALTNPVSAYEQDDGLTVINSPAFKTLEKARKYLLSIVKAEDDCAKDLLIEVASPVVASCAGTVFTVNVTDPRCSSTNPIQTVTKKYSLWVDGIPPSVSITLERDPPVSNPLYSDPERQYVHIDEGTYDFENTGFSYSVQDNCPQEAQVKVTVLSNEFEYAHSKTSENMVMIEEREMANGRQQSHRLRIFVEAQACERKQVQGHLHSKPLCEWDEDTAPFRFYTIKVSASDYSGNVREATATVIILEQGYRDSLRRFGADFDSATFFIDFAKTTPPQNIIKTKQVTWDTSLSTPPPSSNPSLSSTPTTTTAATISFELGVVGLAPPKDDIEEALLVETIKESIIETITPSLSENEYISDVKIHTMGGQPVQSGRFLIEALTKVQYEVTVIDVCTENCDGDVAHSILEKVRDQVTTEVSGQTFTETLQKVAKENGMETLEDASVSSVVVDDDVSATTESKVNVAIAGDIVIGNTDMSRLSGEELNILLVALKEVLESEGCSVISVSSCTVDIISLNGQDLHNIGSRRKKRLLQTSTLTSLLEYTVLIDVDCADASDCLNAQLIADSLNGEVMGALEASVESGELIESLEALLRGTSTPTIDEILANANVALDTSAIVDTPSTGPGTGFSNQSPGTGLSNQASFYPDLEGKSVQCLNIIEVPAYWIDDPSILHSTLESCCKEHYSKFYYICAGSSVGFYPNWENLKSDIMCSNDPDQIPSYMKQSSSIYQYESIEGCCESRFRWDFEECIIKSGGNLATSAENEWYVNWEKKICQQNCLENTGEVQYGASGLNCGGLAPEWEELYATAQDCCENKLAWLALAVCLDESKPPPTIADGTTRWYVNFAGKRCVQDCSSEYNKLAGIVSCGGVVRDASVALYSSPSLCCEENLNWIPHDTCVSDSIKEETGWLHELLESLP